MKFLLALSSQGHDDEARLLCLVYIDGLANWLNLGDKNSPRNFSRALMEYGNNEMFSVVLPPWLLEALPWGSTSPDVKAAVTSAVSALGPGVAFLSSELLDSVRPHLDPLHLGWLEEEVWRGSIANAVYVALRAPGVHRLGGTHGLSISATFHGRPLSRIDLDTLHPALVSLVAHARHVSESTGNWFGVE